MRHVTTITVVLAVLAGSAWAGDRRVRHIAGFKHDRTFTRGHGAEVLIAEVTYAQPVGGQYVAYVELTWGDVDNQVAKTGSLKEWKGKLEVDDGEAVVVRTLNFEAGRRIQTRFDADAYHRAVWHWQEKRETFVQGSAAHRKRQRARAFETIKNRKKLAKALEKTDRQHQQRVAEFDETMAYELAKIKRELTQVCEVPGDEVTQDHGDEVKWKSTTGSGTDGLVIKLLLDKPKTEIEIKAGGHEIEFDTRRDQPVARRRPYQYDDWEDENEYDDDWDDHREVIVQPRVFIQRSWPVVRYPYDCGRRTYRHSRHYVRRGVSRGCYSGTNIGGSFTWGSGSVRARVIVR